MNLAQLSSVLTTIRFACREFKTTVCRLWVLNQQPAFSKFCFLHSELFDYSETSGPLCLVLNYDRTVIVVSVGLIKAF